MGSLFSRSSTSDAGEGVFAPRRIDRRRYHERHPGLHNKPVERTISEITTNVRSPDPKELELLQVTDVDLDIDSNTRTHFTDEFDITKSDVNEREFLVIRRGQTFTAGITFNRPYDAEKDELRLAFQFGKTPKQSKGTHVEFLLSAKDAPNQWGGWIKSSEGNTLKVEFRTPALLPVGKWNLKIDVVKRTDTSVKAYRYEHKDPIYILFNPWCKDDTVFMQEEKLLGEYILAETGKIYAGSTRRISPKPWNFGQFTGIVLDCAIKLLDKCGLHDQARADPVLVSRKISEIVNSPDDNGVLVGNWSGDYSGGTSPLDWPGSVGILEQFYKTNSPVMYGQCWVFSGLVTTVCRALGIPARSVTNFASAHDTDGSITIDNHYDEAGDPMEHYDSDSVWNFHVWNDVWMARPDLPSGYGGWQAIDATPQETSGGVYCVGPMSLRAIREGAVNLPYDGRFVFAEVNADRVIWKVGEGGAMTKLRVLKNRVGMHISTKRAFGKATWREMFVSGDPDREDVTDQYKFPEGSEEERVAVRQANLHSLSSEVVYETTSEDVTFKVETDPDTYIGSDIMIKLTLKNTSAEPRTVNGTLVLSSMYYTGVPHCNLIKERMDETVDPKAEKVVTFTSTANDYLDNLKDHCICKLSCWCFVKETKQHFVEQDELRLRKPHLNIKAPDKARVGDSFEVTVSFENPLARTLTKCELRVEGPGLQKPVVYKQPNVDSKKTFVGSFKMTPVKKGNKEIIVYFNCPQISSINTSHPITIEGRV